MAKQREESIVDVIINGEKAFATVKEMRQTLRQLATEFNASTDPAARERIAKAYQLVNAQLKEQTELLKGNKSLWEKTKETLSTFGIPAASYELIRSAVLAVKEFFADSIKAYDNQVQAEAKLLNALDGRKDVQKELIKQAEHLQRTINIPDEVIIGQQAFLAAQGRSEEQIKKTIAAAVQLSRVTGEELPVVIKKLDATYEGNTGKLAKLDARIGQLTETQLRNGEAIDIIAEKYKGFAEKDLQTGIGPLRQLGLMFDDVKEKAGKLFAALVIPVAKAFMPMLNALADTRSASEKLFDEWKESSAATQSLEKSISPLLDRYDELKNKSSLNTSEQGELKDIIKQVGNALPGAITGFDDYGNAIGISTGKAREFIKAQQDLTAFKNKDAIEESENHIKSYEASINNLLVTLRKGGYEETYNSFANLTKFHALSPDEIKEFQKQVAEMRENVRLLQLQIKELKGQPLVPEPPKTAPVIQSLNALKDKLKELQEAQSQVGIGTDEFKKLQQQIDQTQALIDNATGKTGEAFKKLQDEIKSAEDKILLEQQGKHQAEITEIEQKYDKLREKAKGHAAEITRIDAAEKAEIEAKQKEHNQIISELEDKLHFTRLSKDEQELQEIHDKYQKQIEEFKGFQDKIKELENLRDQEEAAKREEIRQRKLKEREEVQEEIYRMSLSSNEREIVEEAAKWDALIEKAESYGLDITGLYKSQAAAIAAIIKKQKEGEVKSETDTNKKIIEAKKKLFEALSDLIKGIGEVAAAAGVESFEVNKAVTLGQIGIDTASAISSLTKSSEGNPANAETAGLAGIIQFATGIIRIFANMARAGAILNSAPPPPAKYEKGTKLEGPSHENGGIKMYRSDTGELVGEAEGGEVMFGPDFTGENAELMKYLLHRNQTDGGKVTITDLQKFMTSSGPQVNFSRIIETTKIEKYTQGTFIQPTPQGRGRGLANNAQTSEVASDNSAFAEIYSQMIQVVNRTNALLDDLSENGIETYLSYPKFKRDMKRLDGVVGGE